MGWFLVPSTGSVYEMDTPRNPHARETHEARVASGELVEVDADAVEAVPTRHGGVVHRLKASVPAPADEGDGLDRLKVDDLKALATARGIDVGPKATKAALIEALRAPDEDDDGAPDDDDQGQD